MTNSTILTWIMLGTSVVCAALPLSADAREVELSFDDGPDGSGVDDGHERLHNATEEGSGGPGIPSRIEGNVLDLRLVNGAHRSSIAEGKYGRAAVLVGKESAIRVGSLYEGFSFPSRLSVWVALDDSDGGWIIYAPDSFGLRLSGGEVVFSIFDGGTNQWLDHPSGFRPVVDRRFHHLLVAVDGATLKLYSDFAQVASVGLPAAAKPKVTEFYLGYGLRGMMDELLLTSAGSDGSLRFDFDPKDCADPGLACIEEQTTVTPRCWGWPVPVRFKTIYDPQLCSASSPCPLLIAVSGGNSCADDYTSPGIVKQYAAQGFVVAAVDPTCQIDPLGTPGAFKVFPHETSQLIAAKDYLLQRSALAPLLQKGSYFAEGCSHGAGSVKKWALLEDDHPTRTFSRSGGGAEMHHCRYHTVYCEDFKRYFDEGLTGVGYPHSESDPRLAALANKNPPISLFVTPELVRTRSYGASWGVDTSPETPVCTASGGIGCYEEARGQTEGGRQLRDIWQSVEQQLGKKTGFFFEYSAEDCQHCNVGEQGMACIACFLKVGRDKMASECPACLALDPGGPARDCSGYMPEHPDTDLGECTERLAGDGGSAGSNAAADGGTRSTAADAEPAAEPADDGCQVAAGGLNRGCWLAVGLWLALLLRRRRR